MTKQEFFGEVALEIQALKERATSEEIDRLDIDRFDPTCYDKCIYGQMTGDCTSGRAVDLIYDCCPRYVNMPERTPGELYQSLPAEKGFNAIQHLINGQKPPSVEDAYGLLKTRGLRGIQFFSALETYILLPDANNNNVIKFLKGEVDVLEL